MMGFSVMNNHPVIPIVTEDEVPQEESTMLLDESKLSIKKDKVSRRKFSNIDKTVILIRANPNDWTKSDRIRVGTPRSMKTRKFVNSHLIQSSAIRI